MSEKPIKTQISEIVQRLERLEEYHKDYGRWTKLIRYCKENNLSPETVTESVIEIHKLNLEHKQRKKELGIK